MSSVFVLQHSHSPVPGDDDIKLIGVYRTRAAAEAAVERLRNLPGFRNHPRIVDTESGGDEGFHLDEYQLDKDHWVEGFITWTEEMEGG